MWRCRRPEGLVQWASSRSTSSAPQPALWNGHSTPGSFGLDPMSYLKHTESWGTVAKCARDASRSSLGPESLVCLGSCLLYLPARELLAERPQTGPLGSSPHWGLHSVWLAVGALGDRLDFCSCVAGCQPWRAPNGCSTCR